ncbi:MAG TPA: Asp-tRNA(Asn)/Glu-tRNA(Gln) amidotransferase subunit GatA [Vicinamibacterales bacterium]|nr:Asp-tRNA(Asn)/Glu-tRNA(Gln) amidotransferase subunit GatA [Vicinamibacterales bacterium]
MTGLSALELRATVAAGTATAAEICGAALDRIERHAPPLNAFITTAGERARARAAALDRDPASRTLPLAGVPVAVKDNICTRGVRTTAGSRVLEHYVPLYDATVIERIEAAGGLIVGKTNCDEFAMGSSSEHSAFGAVRNPWDRERTAGGSSGGSAVAVAARLVPLALGSETGGSVRQPAALCGIVGIKPTYGRVPRYGLIAFASSLDQVGAFGARAADVAACLQIIAGRDPRDATSAAVPVDDYVQATTRDVAGVRVGVPRALINEGVEPGVRRAYEDAIEVLRSAGAEVRDVELPHSQYATAVYTIVVMAEASSNLSRYDGVRYGTRAEGAGSLEEMYSGTRALFGHEVKRRVMLGTYVLSAGYYDAYYLKAQKVRSLIRQDFERALEDVDVIATPTSPTTAFRLGERLDDPVQMYLADVFTVSANLAGIPAISLPCGFSDGLPVGLQLTGRAWDEATLFRAGAAYERLTPWSAQAPRW